MFDYLELDYETKKGIGSRIPKEKLYKRKKVPFLSILSYYSKTLKSKLRLNWNKTFIILITLLLFFVFALVFIKPIITKFEGYSNTHKKETVIFSKNKDLIAFDFLINSGKNRLLDGRIKDAYKEFKLAYAIYPENKELNILFIETLSILCDRDTSYCKELDANLSKDY